MPCGFQPFPTDATFAFGVLAKLPNLLTGHFGIGAGNRIVYFVHEKITHRFVFTTTQNFCSLAPSRQLRRDTKNENMSTPETITSRIHARSDAQLKAKIARAISDFKSAMTDCGANLYYVGVPIHRNFVRGHACVITPDDYKHLPEQVSIEAERMFDRLDESAFEVAKDKARTLAVDAYMARVEELAANVEELQTEVANIRQ